jgi:Tfp pilus assembly protein PilF
MPDSQEHSRALTLWEEGCRLQLARDLDGAVACYQQSIAICPTAEAHTFLGWAMSWQGDVLGAIEQCRRAIEVDPSFGNPYNDIGAYLIELGRLGEAVDWLERAKQAVRYEPRHFPFLNLARIYSAQGKTTLAIAELERALEIAPGDGVALPMLAKLRSLS